MKQVFHKIMSVVMTFVVLFSTMSFTLNSHYCGDTLVDTAIFHKSETCGMDMEMEKGTPPTDCNVSIKDCCTNEQVLMDGPQQLITTYTTATIDQHVFVASFVYAYMNLFEGLDEKLTSYSTYTPPLVIRQIYKFDETYLI